MDLDAVLGIDWSDPVEQNAAQLVAADEDLLDNLVRLREKLGLSQRDVADRLGVGQSAISRIESGERDPHLSTLRRYALALGARIDHRVTRFEPARPADDWISAVERELAREAAPVRSGQEGLVRLAASAWSGQ